MTRDVQSQSSPVILISAVLIDDSYSSSGSGAVIPSLSIAQIAITSSLILIVVGGCMLAVWYKHHRRSLGLAMPTMSSFSLTMPRFRGSGISSSSSSSSSESQNNSNTNNNSNTERLLNDDNINHQQPLRSRPGGHSLV